MVSEISAAARFSSRYRLRFVPGIGTMSSPRAITHASASSPGAALAGGDRLDPRHEVEIALEVLALETGAAAASRRHRGRQECGSGP